MTEPPKALNARITATMRGNRRVDTGPETRVRSLLHRAGLRFRTDFPVAAGDVKVRPDVVFTAARVAVFIDGCFWHGCPQHGKLPEHNRAYWEAKLERNAARDRRVDAALRSDGWAVVRAWEHEPAEEVAARVAATVGRVRPAGAPARRSGDAARGRTRRPSGT